MLLDMPDREDMGSIAGSWTVVSPAKRPPVNDQVARHEFVESEFAPGCGRCDRCGGGPLAEIHQERVDPMERIATALERIAERFDDITELVLEDSRAMKARRS